MSINQKINSLVVSYKEGSESSLNEIFSHIQPFIEKSSRELEHQVENPTEFECRALLKVKKAADTFDEKVHDFLPTVKARIRDEKADFKRRRHKKKEEVSTEFMENPDEEYVGLEIRDEKADVEEEILFKEKVALLAQGDRKKKEILIQWSRGANDKSISELLAQRFGGNSESHRTFISRFKTKCHKEISSAAI